AVELEVQLGEHAVRVGDLLADQLELRGDVVYSRLEPLHLALQLRPLTADLLQTLAARLQLLLDARRDRQSLLGRELGPSDCITQRERKRECRHAGDRNPGEQPAPTSHQLRSSGGGVAPPRSE